jgi:two-component system KDP operon response regulator KdpE
MPQGLRVLLVEDQELNRALVRTILHRTTYAPLREAELVEAHDLEHARIALSHHDFDVILLDVHLPDGNGLVLLDHYAYPADQNRPVIIAITGGVMPYQYHAAMDAGCDAVLEKPYLPDDLISLVHQLTAAKSHTPAS